MHEYINWKDSYIKVKNRYRFKVDGLVKSAQARHPRESGGP